MEEASNEVVVGTVLICSVETKVLFDSEATHSFLSPHLARRLGRWTSSLEIPLVVATLLGKSLEVEVVYRDYEMLIEDHNMSADLILLEMISFDSILGMN